jgi:hypothetical protein
VTVRAPDLAFVDLSLDDGPRRACPYKLTDLCLLVAKMVEIEKHRIRDAAVDAGNAEGSHSLASLPSAIGVTSSDVRDVRCSVLSIPLS